MNRFFLTLIVLLFLGCLTDQGFTQTVDSVNPERTDLQRHGSLIKLKKEYEERYIILHKHTFPGVLESLQKSNITNYTIFLLDGVLFSHFEYVGLDFANDMKLMGNEVTKEWWKLTDPMQEPFEKRKKDEWWVSAELLYQMNISKFDFRKAQRLAFVGELREGQLQTFKIILNGIENSYLQLILSYNIQNWTAYEKDNKIYFYYEYVGKNIRKDITDLENTSGFQAFSNKIEPLFKSTGGDKKQVWRYMKEIFHTD